MNKHCFRLIFSKTLGFLIPVAEIARAQRKPGQHTTATPVILSPTEAFSWSLKRLVLSVLLAGAPGWAMADILVDPTTPAGSTNVINAANGVPVIEIANPNAKGLSHNRFSEFDVQQPGVIFNNSRANGVSQIGGAVLLNPNLQRTATAILTEVTGNKPSTISGTLEVFGDKADLLIAKVHPRWEELHQDIYPANRSSELSPHVQELRTVKAPWWKFLKKAKTEVIQKADEFDRRIIVDTIGSDDTRAYANLLLKNFPNNTVVFEALSGANAEYVGGKFAPQKPKSIEPSAKLSFLRDADKMDKDAIFKIYREGIRGKLETEVKVKAIVGESFEDNLRPSLSNLVSLNRGHTPAEVESTPAQSEAPRIDNAGQAGRENVIREAEQQGLLDAARADFLELARKKVSEKLKKGPVLLGEHHNVPDSAILLKQLIADNQVKQLLLKRPKNDAAVAWQWRKALMLANENGYPDIESFLADAHAKGGVWKDHEVVKNLIKAYREPYKDARINYGDQLIAYALERGVPLNYIDARPKMKDFNYEVDYRNRMMAWNIKGSPQLNAPGVIGSFGAEHLSWVEKDRRLLPPLQQLAGIPESQVYDLSPAFHDQKKDQIYPRWSELGRRAGEEAPMRISTLRPFKMPDSNTPKETQYARDKYGSRIVVDGVKTPASRELASRLAKKYPSNTIVFNEGAGGELEYASGTFFHEPKITLNSMKFHILQDVDAPVDRTKLKGLIAKTRENVGVNLEVKKVKRINLVGQQAAPAVVSPESINLQGDL